MANKPVLRRAVAKTKIKANDYNWNFEQMNNYVDEVMQDVESKVSKSGDTMTGTLNVPTPDYTDNSTRVATTEFVNLVVPTGTVIASANSATPTGYLYCNGAEISRTTYANLFKAIGTTYGTGDGSTTFNLPNYSTYKFVTSGTVSIKGNGKTLGLTDGTLTGGMTANNNYAAYGVFQKGAYNVKVGTAVTPGSKNDWTNNNKSIGVTTDASKSGLTGSVTTQTLKWYIKY